MRTGSARALSLTIALVLSGAPGIAACVAQCVADTASRPAAAQRHAHQPTSADAATATAAHAHGAPSACCGATVEASADSGGVTRIGTADDCCPGVALTAEPARMAIRVDTAPPVPESAPAFAALIAPARYRASSPVPPPAALAPHRRSVVLRL